MMEKLPRRKSDELFNDSFHSLENILWWSKVQYYRPNPLKPIVFLPCSRQKPFSKSMTHSFLGSITKDPGLQKIVLSEPLVIVPYELEDKIPAYNYPPKLLQQRPVEKLTFIHRLEEFLNWIKYLSTNTIYYVGGKHHYEILTKANKMIDLELIAIIPERGIRDYSQGAKQLRALIPA